MKALVAYMSKTGNTKKVAEAIFGEIDCEKEMNRIDDVDSIEGYDIAFLGFPIHAEGPDKKTAELLKKHCISGRNVVLFITHASPEDNPELQPMLDKFRQAAGNANIIGMFDCQGELARAIKFVMSMMPNAKYRAWARQDNSKGQPDETRLNNARAFSRDIMKKFHEVEYDGKYALARTATS